MTGSLSGTKQWLKSQYSKISWSWANKYLNGGIAKAALTVPLLGYLILLNDQIADHLQFTVVADGRITWGLNGIERLQLIYFGLVILAVLNIAFKTFRPRELRNGNSILEFTRESFDFNTKGDYSHIYGILAAKSNSLNLIGGNYDVEWKTYQLDIEQTQNGKYTGDWNRSKLQYEHLLKEMLHNYYILYDRQGKAKIILLMAGGFLGYLLLTLPAIDIFLKVLYTVALQLNWTSFN